MKLGREIEIYREKKKTEFFAIFRAKLIISERDVSGSSRGELGDGLGSLTDGVLGELTWEEESDGGLDLAGAEGVLLVVADEAGALSSDLLEDIVDEGVHDAHGSLGDASLGVDLLEHSVDVDREGFGSLSLGSGLSGAFLSSGSLSGFLCHFEVSF